MKDELEGPRRSRKRRLTLGVDKVSNITDQLIWEKLEACFGTSFTFDSEMKYELAHELALQHGRLDKGVNGELPYDLRKIKESAKALMNHIGSISLSSDEPNSSAFKNTFRVENNCKKADFDIILENLSNLKSGDNYCPPSDLYRDCMKAIASQLNRSGLTLSLYKNSSFHKFIMELDNQLPNTIFPATEANYADDSRFRAMRDYLRSWFREKI